MEKQKNSENESVLSKFCSMLDMFTKWINRICNIVTIAYLVIFIVAITVLFMNFYDNGWSFFNKKKQIVVDNSYYEAGMKFWEELDYKKAEENMLVALEQISQSKGADSLEAATVSQKLGALYLDIGRYEESYERLNSAYVTFYKNLGEEDGNTIVAKCQISIYDIKTGNIERGFATLNESFEQTKYIPYKIQIAQMVAQCNILLGDYKKALEWYELLKIMYENIGGSTLTLVNFYNDYGILMTELGEYDKALEYLTEAVRQWETLNVTEDMTIANVYANLAKVYALCGQYENAIETGEKGISVLCILAGDDSVHVARAYENMASIYGDLRMQDTQIEYLERALAIAEIGVGKNHDVTAEIYNMIGNYYMGNGEILSAVSNYEEALEIRKNLLGKNSLVTVAVYQNLAECYYRLEKYDEGVENAQEAIRICEFLCGKDNINTASAYMTLAWIYERMGNEREAGEFVQIALDIIDRHERTANVMTAQAYQTAGDIFMCQNCFEEAADSYWKSWVICGQIFLKEDSYASEFDEKLKKLYEELETPENYGDWIERWKAGELRDGEGKV